MHAMLTPRAAGHSLSQSVALPENIGKAAAEAGAKTVVLGHLMASTRAASDTDLWSLSSPDSVLAAVRTAYDGDVSLASDLECFRL
jgi:ribonuclease BN (tRNA processing enzyme)